MGRGSVIDFSLLFFTEAVKHKDWSQIPPPHANQPDLEPAAFMLESWVVGFESTATAGPVRGRLCS